MKRNLKEILEETVTVGKVAVIIGLVVFGLLMYYEYVDWATIPKETQVEIDRAVENMLLEENVSVFQKAYLRNEFVEGVGLGGAGGMGNNVIGSRNAQDFVETIQHNNIKEVYCVYEGDGHRFIKRYWALSSGGTHELRQVHTAPVRNNDLYSPKECNETTVIFGMNNISVIEYWLTVVLIYVLIGMIVGLIARALLSKIFPDHVL